MQQCSCAATQYDMHWHECMCECECVSVQAAPISLRCAKSAINAGLETDLLNGMKVEEAQYAKVRLQ